MKHSKRSKKELRKQLKQDSLIVCDSSMEILREFEPLDAELLSLVDIKDKTSKPLNNKLRFPR